MKLRAHPLDCSRILARWAGERVASDRTLPTRRDWHEVARAFLPSSCTLVSLVRKAILLIIASLLLIAGIALYVITRSSSETVALRFVDAVTGAPVTNVTSTMVTLKGFFNRRVDEILFDLHIVTPARPIDSEFT
jgi:hypothetical protein